jgi:hypothetical protein
MMIRVAVVTADAGTSRSVLNELAARPNVFEPFPVTPPDAPAAVHAGACDVLLLDIQAVSQLDAHALTDAICHTHPKGGFICCCSGCAIDRARISMIEKAGAPWCPLPSSEDALVRFVQQVRKRGYEDELAHVSFLAALWELALENETELSLAPADESCFTAETQENAGGRLHTIIKRVARAFSRRRHVHRSSTSGSATRAYL